MGEKILSEEQEWKHWKSKISHQKGSGGTKKQGTDGQALCGWNEKGMVSEKITHESPIPLIFWALVSFA